MTPPPPFDPRSLYSSTNASSSTSTSNTTSTGTPSRPNLASASPAPSGPSSKREPSGGAGDDTDSFPCTAGAGGKKKPSKRRKVNLACIYCRRSHMTCDEGRPCQRCVKRDIGHLCHDEAMPAKVHGGGDGEMGNSGTPSKAKVQSKAGTEVGSGSATPAAAAATDANASASNFFPTLGLGSTDAGAAGGSNSGNGNNGGSAFNGSSNGPYSSASPMSLLNQNNYAEFGAAKMFKQPQPQPPTTSTAPAQGGASMQPSTSNNNAGMLSLASLFNMTNPTPSTTTTANNNTTTAQGGSVGNGNISQPTQPTTSAPTGDISGLGGAGWLGLGGGYKGGGSGFGGDSAGGNEFTLLSEFLESLDGPGFVAGATPGTTGAAAQTSSGLTPSQSRRNTISGLASTSGGMMEGLTALTPINANANNDRSNSLSALTSSNNTGNIYDPNSGSGYNGFNTTTQQPTQNNEGNGKRSRRPSFSASTSANTTTTTTTAAQGNSSIASGSYLPSLQGGSSKTERFFLTAADQKDGTRDERLARVIQAKYEAGLLRPYNHVNGYARLNRWMERNVSAASKRRILKPLCVFRPAFRAVAQSLTNIDLVFIEEAFERLLLDYDRVFSTQGIPACLWRRTGEIYKGNKEFAELVGVPIEGLREGRLCIYELMAEESAVNYWEKYGAVSFDPGQKAVLTSCVLRTKNKAIVAGGVGNGGTAQSAKSIAAQLARSGSASGQQTPITEGRVGGGVGMKEDEKVAAETGATSTSGVLKDPNNPKAAFIHCCFSFTIRRDQWNIPHMIVGNFLPTNPP